MKPIIYSVCTKLFPNLVAKLLPNCHLKTSCYEYLEEIVGGGSAKKMCNKVVPTNQDDKVQILSVDFLKSILKSFCDLSIFIVTLGT